MQQMPRMIMMTSTPAWLASASRSMTSRSVSEFILSSTRAGCPVLARDISRSMPLMTSGLSDSGATPR